MIYPFKCRPVYKEKIWGGRWLEKKFGRILPDNISIGESWELTCRNDAMSIIDNGDYTGIKLFDIIERFPDKILGNKFNKIIIETFPLLIKFIDANDKLSIQVHPRNESAEHQMKIGFGKIEMWYIVDCDENSKLIVGLKNGITKERFVDSIEKDDLQNCLNEISIKPGDAIFIPAGTVHSILERVRIAEIQQNADITYRIYDWNRTGLDGRARELHISKALESIDFNGSEIKPMRGIILDENNKYKRRILSVCKYFAVEEMIIKNLIGNINPDRFEIWTVLDGAGKLKTKKYVYEMIRGETWFIPAYLGDYEIIGNLKILRTYIPDINNEIILPLLSGGFTKQDMSRIAGLI